LGVTNFKSLLSGFVNVLNRSECLVCLTSVHVESCLGDNIINVVLFLSFPKYPIALIVVVKISSYKLISGMTESVQIWAEMSSLSCLTLLDIESS
jgi:hypothetical protein